MYCGKFEIYAFLYFILLYSYLFIIIFNVNYCCYSLFKRKKKVDLYCFFEHTFYSSTKMMLLLSNQAYPCASCPSSPCVVVFMCIMNFRYAKINILFFVTVYNILYTIYYIYLNCCKRGKISFYKKNREIYQFLIFLL